MTLTISQAILKTPLAYLEQEHKLRKSQRTIFHVGAQVNGSPHLGTVSTIALTFALAQQATLNGLEAAVDFTLLDNTYLTTDHPRETRRLKMGDRLKFQQYEKEFNDLITWAASHTQTPVSFSYYEDIQSSEAFRKELERILALENEEILLFDPSSCDGANVGVYCPKCFTTNLTQPTQYFSSPEGLQFNLECIAHGSTTVSLADVPYIDTGALIRNIIKERLLAQQTEVDSNLRVIIKGVDWAPLSHFITQGLDSLRTEMRTRPVRLFLPLVYNETGTKLSKSDRAPSVQLDNELWNGLKQIVNEPQKFYSSLKKEDIYTKK